jgi:hypothetical protein
MGAEQPEANVPAILSTRGGRVVAFLASLLGGVAAVYLSLTAFDTSPCPFLGWVRVGVILGGAILALGSPSALVKRSWTMVVKVAFVVCGAISAAGLAFWISNVMSASAVTRGDRALTDTLDVLGAACLASPAIWLLFRGWVDESERPSMRVARVLAFLVSLLGGAAAVYLSFTVFDTSAYAFLGWVRVGVVLGGAILVLGSPFTLFERSWITVIKAAVVVCGAPSAAGCSFWLSDITSAFAVTKAESALSNALDVVGVACLAGPVVWLIILMNMEEAKKPRLNVDWAEAQRQQVLHPGPGTGCVGNPDEEVFHMIVEREIQRLIDRNRNE